MGIETCILQWENKIKFQFNKQYIHFDEELIAVLKVKEIVSDNPPQKMQF